MRSFRKLLFLLITSLFAQQVLAATKSLLELSKSKKKIKDGEYEFLLDTTQEIKKGTPVTPEIVKDALEKKLGSSHGVKVTPKGKDSVIVAYTGAENEFLEKVGKTKIRAGGDVELALESSGSDGGIRASKLDRKPAANEVKGQVTKKDKDYFVIRVQDSQNEKIKTGSSVKVKLTETTKVKDIIFFVPETESSGIWTPKAGSEQLITK